MVAERDTVTAPYVVLNTGRFDGDDGKWSTFAISIGTPPQSVRVLPGTVNTQVTVPFEEGCTGPVFEQVQNCADLRGIDNSTRKGFIRGDSRTWQTNSLRDLYAQQQLIKDTGLYGFDTVSVGRSGDSGNVSFTGQSVAGISQIPYFLGSLGLSSAATNISTISTPSLLTTMKNQSQIPSLSYGYFAGQSYNNNKAGSLILGGYDKALMSDAIVTVPIDRSSAFPKLRVNIGSLVSQNAAGGATRGFLNDVSVSIDTTTNQMWLPSSVCDSMVTAFGLSEDRSTGYFLLNETQHASLKSSNPTLTFTVGGNGASGTTNIKLSYNALDMSVGIPIYNASIPYFPIRRAANDSQLVFGRAFLQEAYLVVDWERNNFTIGPVGSGTQQNVVPIRALASQSSSSGSPDAPGSTSTSAPGSSGGLSGGAIAGIIIPIVLIIAVAAGLFFFFRRRKQQKRAKQAEVRQSYESQPPEYDPHGGSYYAAELNAGMVKKPENEIAEMFDSSKPRAELTADNVRRLEELAEQRELMSTPILELEGDRADSELDGGSQKGDRTSGMSNNKPDRTSGMSSKGDRTSGLSGVVSPLRQSVTSPPPERVTSPLSRQSIYEME